MSNPNKKNKRRRHIRYPIELLALLVTDPATAIPCTILDFCSGGFFLELKHSGIELFQLQPIKLQFSLQDNGDWKNYEQPAQVMHVTPTGVGVAVENLPLATFDALKQYSEQNSSRPISGHRHNLQDKLKQQGFKNELNLLLIDRLPVFILKFYDSLGPYLRSVNEHAVYFANSSKLDDLVTTLKLNKELLISEFCNTVIAQTEQITASNRSPEPVIPSDIGLSLIEKEDFEDWLKVSAIIRQLNNRFEHELFSIAAELSRIFGVSKLAVHSPVNPSVLCDAFRDVVLQLGFETKTQSMLYECFENVLAVNLPALYHDTRQLLARHKTVNPTAEQSVGKRSHENPQNDTSAYLDQQEPVSYEGLSLGSTHPNLTLPTRTNSINSGFTHYETGRPTMQIAEKLLGFLHDTAQQQSTYKPKSGSGSILDSDEINATLARTSSVKTSAIQRLEIYDSFFESLFAELELASPIKPYLERLRSPLLATAETENAFLESGQHPAKTIINQIAALEPAVKTNKHIKGINVKNALDKLLERIKPESGHNTQVFAEVEQELHNLTQQITKAVNTNIQRIIESYEGQQQLEAARRQVQVAIYRRMAGKPVPAIIPRLLDSGWQHLLVIEELNTHIPKQQNTQTWLVLDKLFNWLSLPDEEITPQLPALYETLAYIEENLRLVCTNAFEFDEIIHELKVQLIGQGSQKQRKPPSFTNFSAQPTLENPVNESHDDFSLQVEQLNVGDWLMVAHANSPHEAMKLIWIGTVLPLYVFVNRDGLEKLELNKAELTALMRHGSAYKIDNLDIPLVDRASNAMVQNVHGKLIFNATHDVDTGLLTKDEFIKHLKNELPGLANSQHIICHIEVQDLRLITNVCGAGGGIEFLKTLAGLIIGQLNSQEIVARLGDKAFGLLLKNRSADEAYEIAKKLAKFISGSRFHWQDKSFPMAVSFGLTAFSERCYDIGLLLQQADAASLSAEQTGQNGIMVFENDNEAITRQNRIYQWAGQIDQVFTENRLFSRCQKIAQVDPTLGRHEHYEILLGILDEQGKIIPPDLFIPAVERSKRMPELDQWVIKNVFNWIGSHYDDFIRTNGFSINLSGQSISNEEFLEFLQGFLAASAVPGEKITFEITETVAAGNLSFTKQFISKIKKYGCKFSLDDFGSGYSSYSYLKNLQVDYLKIDGAFVKDIANNKADVAIVKSMNEIAHSLGLKTIAEYVENERILEILRTIGVDYAQGFGIHKPMPLADLVFEDLPAADDKGLLFLENDAFWQI